MRVETTYDLVQTLSDVFDDTLCKPTDNRITAPILVIYSGEKAAEYDGTVMSAFRQVWLTARAEHICRAVRSNGSLTPIKSNEDIFSYVDKMYHCDEVVFDSFSRLNAVAVYDSRDYDSLDDMIRDYENDAESLSHEFRLYKTNVVRLVIVDNSRDKIEIKEGMRKYLSQKSDEKKCKGTFLFSNSLFDGRQKSYDQVYDLIGKLIAIGGTDTDFANKLDVFGVYSEENVRTVSYTKMERPNAEICAVIVKRYINRLENYFLSQNAPNEKIIREKLNLKDNGFGFTDALYDEIKSDLPSVSVLAHLPMSRAPKENESFAGLQFSEFDKLTMGGFELFYDKYFLSVICDGATKEAMRGKVQAIVDAAFTQGELMHFSGELIDKLKGWLQNAVRHAPPGQTVSQYVETYSKIALEKILAELVIDAIIAKRDMAYKQKEMLSELSDDFNQSVIISDTDVSRYYDAKIDDYLREKEGVFVQSVMNGAESKQDVLTRLHSFASKMIESCVDFKLAFEDELKIRTNDENGIYMYIHENIMANTSRNIFFNATTMPDPLFRVILMNKKKSDGTNTALYTEMKQNLFNSGNDYFLDNGNSNGITALQIYKMSSVAVL